MSRIYTKYTSKELEKLKLGVDSGLPISSLEGLLEDRGASGIAKKLQTLSTQDPNTWNPEKIIKVVAEYKSELWISPRNDPERVEESKKRVLDYLREHPDAKVLDLENAGLSYDLSVGYDNKLNDARSYLGLEERARGQQLSKKQRKQRILSYLREHPNATTPEIERAGYKTELYVVPENIDSLRVEAGIIPEGHISAAEAARKLGKSREGISFLFRDGKLGGLKVGRRMYISETSVNNYSVNSSPTLK